MFVRDTFWLWTTGSFTSSTTVVLDRSRRYLVSGGLVGKEGGDYGQVFVSTVCTIQSSDQVLCGGNWSARRVMISLFRASRVGPRRA